MAEAVFSESRDADLLIMAAAVADYKPCQESDTKIKKDQGGLDVVKLERTVDILGEIVNIIGIDVQCTEFAHLR